MLKHGFPILFVLGWNVRGYKSIKINWVIWKSIGFLLILALKSDNDNCK